ncbi:hypothetical protein MNEG_16026, partial [Monoraphidium neglectum]
VPGRRGARPWRPRPRQANPPQRAERAPGGAPGRRFGDTDDTGAALWERPTSRARAGARLMGAARD